MKKYAIGLILIGITIVSVSVCYPLAAGCVLAALIVTGNHEKTADTH